MSTRKKKLEKKKLARQILVKNVGAEKKKLASVLSRKFSWDRARAERAILRVFGPNRGGGVGPYEAQKVARTRGVRGRFGEPISGLSRSLTTSPPPPGNSANQLYSTTVVIDHYHDSTKNNITALREKTF